jgi:hypothetical protein
MLSIKRATIRTAATITGAILGAWLLAIPVNAQLAGVGCQCVSDSPVEANTSIIAASVSTGGGAGIWTAQGDYLSNLMQLMGSGVADSATFAALYPGWVDPGPEAIYQAQYITTEALNTDAAALSIVQSQAADFPAEDAKAAAIEKCNAAAGAAGSLLMAQQCNTEAQLLNFQQGQLQRQLEMTLITVEAVNAGETLDEKTQVRAADAVNFNLGVMP